MRSAHRPARPTIRLSWDELDDMSCVEHASPDWNSLTVVGPTRIRDARGNVTLHRSVTVQCQPATPLPIASAPPPAELDPVEPPPQVGAAA
jgi:hypothetical protein